VMLGLLLWHERTGTRPALDACVRAADLMCRTFLDGPRRVFDAGSHEMNMAVIHVLCALHRKTIERALPAPRARDREGLGAGGRLLPRGHGGSRVLQDSAAAVGEPPRLAGARRAVPHHRRLALSSSVREPVEEHCRPGRAQHGRVLVREQAVGAPLLARAHRDLLHDRVGWRSRLDMLRLTGDAAAADALELSTFNAMAGAQHPSGRWWTYNTPMDGVREASAHSIVFQARAGTPDAELLQRVNGPRGLGMLAEWAVMSDAEGVAVNFYGPMKASPRAARRHGQSRSRRPPEYPVGSGDVAIAVRVERPSRFALKLRRPAWDPGAKFTHPAELASRDAGGLTGSSRARVEGRDRGACRARHELRATAGERRLRGQASLFRGPILLAYDRAWNAFRRVCNAAARREKPLVGSRSAVAAHLARRESSRRGSHGGPRPRGAKDRDVVLCDFASAGAAGTRYRTWLPAVNVERPRACAAASARAARCVPAVGDPVPVGVGWRRRTGSRSSRSGGRERPLVHARGRGAVFSSPARSRRASMSWQRRAAAGEGTPLERFTSTPRIARRGVEPPPDLPPAPGPEGGRRAVIERRSAVRRSRGTADSSIRPGSMASAGGRGLRRREGPGPFRAAGFPARDYAMVAHVRVRAFVEGSHRAGREARGRADGRSRCGS
jgi:hypothetical protein